MRRDDRRHRRLERLIWLTGMLLTWSVPVLAGSTTTLSRQTLTCRGTIVYALVYSGQGHFDGVEALCLGPDGTYR